MLLPALSLGNRPMTADDTTARLQLSPAARVNLLVALTERKTKTNHRPSLYEIYNMSNMDGKSTYTPRSKRNMHAVNRLRGHSYYNFVMTGPSTKRHL